MLFYGRAAEVVRSPNGLKTFVTLRESKVLGVFGVLSTICVLGFSQLGAVPGNLSL